MIICSNCGAINTDETSRFCRKCGALLPVAVKPSRIRIQTNASNTKKKQINSSTINTNSENMVKSKETNQTIPYINREAGFFTPKAKKQNKLDGWESELKQHKNIFFLFCSLCVSFFLCVLCG